MPPGAPEAAETALRDGGEGAEEDGPGVRGPFVWPEVEGVEEEDGEGGEGAALGYEGVGLEG